jgi:hypothetical protein
MYTFEKKVRQLAEEEQILGPKFLPSMNIITNLKVVTNEKREAVGEVLTIIC